MMLPVGVAERDEQLVLRLPRVRDRAGRAGRHVAVAEVRLPVERALLDHVGAAAVVLGREDRVEPRAGVRRAEQRRAGLLVAVDARDDEVVPLGPVHVDHDRAEAERPPDGDGRSRRAGGRGRPSSARAGSRRRAPGCAPRARGRESAAWAAARRPGGGRPGCSSTVRAAATTIGSNWVPDDGVELADRLRAGHRAAVGAVARHGVVGVADGDDARAERDRRRRPGRRDSRRRRRARGSSARCAATPPSTGAAFRIASPVRVWRRMISHSALSSGPGLVQDRAGDDHLADVVQVGGEARCRRSPRARLPSCSATERASSATQSECGRRSGACWSTHGEEQIARLPLRRDAVVVLLGVHALVDDAQRRRRVAGLTRQEGEAARRADRLVLLGQRLERLADRVLELGRRPVQEHAELVSAQPVGGARRRERRRQAGAEPRQQRVAGRVPVGVVVGLEPVEVEHREHRGGVVGALGDGPLEVDQEPAPVAQAGQVVGQRLPARLLDARPARGVSTSRARPRQRPRSPRSGQARARPLIEVRRTYDK